MDGWKEKKNKEWDFSWGAANGPFIWPKYPQHIIHHRIDQCLPPCLLIKGVSGRITPRSLPQSPYLTGKTLAFPCS